MDYHYLHLREGFTESQRKVKWIGNFEVLTTSVLKSSFSWNVKSFVIEAKLFPKYDFVFLKGSQKSVYISLKIPKYLRYDWSHFGLGSHLITFCNPKLQPILTWPYCRNWAVNKIEDDRLFPLKTWVEISWISIVTSSEVLVPLSFGFGLY